jgi:DNA-binding response OmpR family regulator
MATSFAISEWSGWQATLSDGYSDESEALTISEAPDVTMIPLMLRRRLDLLGRACGSEILKHLTNSRIMPIVYCSQHGDIERTTKVLNELADDQLVSPMHFSLAVHNAICGILSIQTGLTSNISTIAAGQEGLVPVLLEATGILLSGAEKVLCVICDVTLPEIYQDEQSLPKISYAISFVVSKAKGVPLSLTQLPQHLDKQEINQLPTCLIGFLSSNEAELLINHNEATWKLARY